MRVLSGPEKQAKLEALAESEGFPSVIALLEAAATDSICPAICTEQDCSYTADMESDQDRGWCEVCNQTTVASALILAGLI